MLNIMIDEDCLLDALHNRVTFWTDDEDVITLFDQYYEHMVYAGCFSGSKIDIMGTVDNDYVNWFSVYGKEEMDGEEWITEDRIFAEHNGLYLVYCG